MELAEHWMDKGHDVVGTFRTRNERLSALETQGVKTCYCDLLDLESMKEAAIYLQQNVPEWDAIILAPGLQEPVGPFLQSNFDEWAASVEANLFCRSGTHPLNSVLWHSFLRVVGQITQHLIILLTPCPKLV